MKLRFATTVIAAVGAALLTAVPATTATAAAPGHPAAAEAATPDRSAEFPVTVDDFRMTFRGKDIALDLTGNAKLMLGSPAPGDLKAEALSSLTATGSHPELGKVTVAAEGTGSVTFDSVIAPFPAELDLSTGFKVIVEKGAESQVRSMAREPREPLVLTTKHPGQLAGRLTSFPPQGEVYQLLKPVDLVRPGSEEVVASLDKFPVKVGSL